MLIRRINKLEGNEVCAELIRGLSGYLKSRTGQNAGWTYAQKRERWRDSRVPVMWLPTIFWGLGMAFGLAGTGVFRNKEKTEAKVSAAETAVRELGKLQINSAKSGTPVSAGEMKKVIDRLRHEVNTIARVHRETHRSWRQCQQGGSNELPSWYQSHLQLCLQESDDLLLRFGLQLNVKRPNKCGKGLLRHDEGAVAEASGGYIQIGEWRNTDAMVRLAVCSQTPAMTFASVTLDRNNRDAARLTSQVGDASVKWACST